MVNQDLRIYHLVMTFTVCWLENPKNSHGGFTVMGKSSISMGYLYHGYVSHNQKV